MCGFFMSKKIKLNSKLIKIVTMVTFLIHNPLYAQQEESSLTHNVSAAVEALGQGIRTGANPSGARVELFKHSKQHYLGRQDQDIVSGECTDCAHNEMAETLTSAGLDAVSRIARSADKDFCAYPEEALYCSAFDQDNATLQGHTTTNVLDFCECVGAYREGSGVQSPHRYRDIEPEEARNFCREAGNHQVKQRFNRQIETINAFGAIQAFARSALGLEKSYRCDESQVEQIFKNLLPAANDDGKRLCSAQTTAFILNALESEAGFLNDNRKSIYNETFARANSLGGAQTEGIASQQQSIQAQLDAYVGSANSYFESQRNQFQSNLAAWAHGINPNFEEESLGIDQIGAFLSTNQVSKASLAKNLYELFRIEQGRKRAEDFFDISDQFSAEIDVKKMISGEIEMTEEVATKLLEKFVSVSDRECGNSLKNIEVQCKMVSTGSDYNPALVASNSCLLKENPEFEEFVRDPLKTYMERAKYGQNRGISGQIMCYQAIKFGGLNAHTENLENERCNEDTLHAQGARDFSSAVASKDGGFEEFYFGARHAAVSAEIDNCTPFVVGALNDEVDPLNSRSDLKELLKEATQQRENSVMDEVQQAVTVAQRTGGDPSAAARSIVSGRGRFNISSGSTMGSNNPNARYSRRDALSAISENAARRAASESGSYTVPSDSFYSSMGTNQIKSVPDFSSFDADEASSSSLSSVADSRSSSDPLEAERRRIDEYLGLLQQREEEYKRMLAELQRQGVKEVVNDEGEKVSVEDAFAATNAKIEEQRALAMKERDDLERRLKGAERTFETDRNNRGIASNTQSGDSSRPTVSSTPSGNNSAPSNSASRTIASVGSSTGLGGGVGATGSSGSGSSSPSQYGPAPFQGIVLTSKELSIAKPKLDLGGRSLNESVEVIRAAIEAVKGEVRLPVQYVNGKPVLDYILQEQDGKTVMVYLDGEKVVVADVNLAVDSAQDEVVVEVTPEAAEEAPVEPEIRAPAQSGRKAWADVEAILDDAQ